MRKIIKFLLIVLITIALIFVVFILFNTLDPIFLDKGDKLPLKEVQDIVKNNNLLFNDDSFNHYEFLGRKKLDGKELLVIKMINTEKNVIVIMYIDKMSGNIVKKYQNNGIFNTYLEVQ